MTRVSERLNKLPHYTVNELATAKKRMMARGVDVIDLSVGDADIPPPDIAVKTLRDALADQAMSRYSFQIGLIEFRESVARYMKRRFDVTVDPMTEVLPLIGSKNGLSHLPFAILNAGDICIIPEPGYPGYFGTYLSDAEVLPYPLEASKEFLLELDDLSDDKLSRTALVFLNYPNNPTSAIAPRDYLERTVNVCRENDIVLAYDNPYCEMTFDGYEAPSILELPGAREVSLEFHSLSKSFCMTGWRLGWATGSAELIAALQKVKSYVDTGPFLAVTASGSSRTRFRRTPGRIDAAGVSGTPRCSRAFLQGDRLRGGSTQSHNVPLDRDPSRTDVCGVRSKSTRGGGCGRVARISAGCKWGRVTSGLP